MGYDEEMLDVYRKFVVNRHLIWKFRQEGLPAPWSDDPILMARKFTNMFRVLDHGSQFLMRRLMTDDPLDYLARCVFYRITNLPETWDVLQDELGEYPRAHHFTHESDLLYEAIHQYRSVGNKVFSGAYIIVPAPGTKGDKVRDAIALTKGFIENHAADFFNAETQEDRFKALRQTNGLGKFLSMQILTDWGYGLDENKENEFVIAGPGARRGAAHLNAELSAERVIWELAVEWEGDPVVEMNGHSLGLMNVQNTLCEFSKYVRYMSAHHPHPYVPAHPGSQPKPVLPKWMEARN